MYLRILNPNRLQLNHVSVAETFISVVMDLTTAKLAYDILLNETISKSGS